MNVKGWEDAEGRIYEMSTAWDDQPGDAWCYVVMADWGKGNYTSYTVPTVIAVSEQWLVTDPRVA